MAGAALYIVCGKKIDADDEKAIKDKIAGRRFLLPLQAADIDAKGQVADSDRIGKKLMELLTKEVPLLAKASGFSFRQSVKATGELKLTVATDTERPFTCSLELRPPAIKPVRDTFEMSKLIDCKFKDVLESRGITAYVSYEVAHPRASKLMAECDAAMQKLGKAIAAAVTKAVTETVARLNEGLNGAMTHDEGKKLADGLVDKIQDQIDLIAEASEKVLNATLGKHGASVADYDVVARYDKFKLRKGLVFPGGGTPAVDGKSLDGVTMDAAKLGKKVASAEDGIAEIKKAAQAFCADTGKLLQRPAPPPNAKTGDDKGATDPAELIIAELGPRRTALNAQIQQVVKQLAADRKAAESIVKDADKVRKTHEKDAPAPASAKADHAKESKQLVAFKKQATTAIERLENCERQCEALSIALKGQNWVTAEGAKKIDMMAEKLSGKDLGDMGKSLLVSWQKIVAELKD